MSIGHEETGLKPGRGCRVSQRMRPHTLDRLPCRRAISIIGRTGQSPCVSPRREISSDSSLVSTALSTISLQPSRTARRINHPGKSPHRALAAQFPAVTIQTHAGVPTPQPFPPSHHTRPSTHHHRDLATQLHAHHPITQRTTPSRAQPPHHAAMLMTPWHHPPATPPEAHGRNGELPWACRNAAIGWPGRGHGISGTVKNQTNTTGRWIIRSMAPSMETPEPDPPSPTVVVDLSPDGSHRALAHLPADGLQKLYTHDQNWADK